MKQLRLVLLVFASALGLARAEEEENRAPPTDIPDFSNLDEYVYQAKSTLYISMRQLSGAKAHFSGTGKLLSPEDPGLLSATNVIRTYHDGSVSPDQRTAGRTDGSGNPVIDPVTNGQVFDPSAPDGRTNTWTYTDARQGTEVPGMVTFHSYSEQVTDPTVRTKDASSAFGVEVAVARDMGSLLHTRMTWSLFAGMSLNDISVKSAAKVQAAVTTRTDGYSLNGQALPAPVYNAPSTGSTSVLDTTGNIVYNGDGSVQTVATDTTVLLSSQPTFSVTSTNTAGTVLDQFKLKGAYFTFRAGPMVTIPITTKLHADFSAGLVIMAGGTYYNVSQTFDPDFGGEITDAIASADYNNSNTSSLYRVIPGYYADASLQYDLTDHAGFFAGASFQGAGSYTQKLDTDTQHYVTKVDLGRQQGLRAGMTVRF